LQDLQQLQELQDLQTRGDEAPTSEIVMPIHQSDEVVPHECTAAGTVQALEVPPAQVQVSSAVDAGALDVARSPGEIESTLKLDSSAEDFDAWIPLSARDRTLARQPLHGSADAATEHSIAEQSLESATTSTVTVTQPFATALPACHAVLHQAVSQQISTASGTVKTPHRVVEELDGSAREASDGLGLSTSANSFFTFAEGQSSPSMGNSSGVLLQAAVQQVENLELESSSGATSPQLQASWYQPSAATLSREPQAAPRSGAASRPGKGALGVGLCGAKAAQSLAGLAELDEEEFNDDDDDSGPDLPLGNATPLATVGSKVSASAAILTPPVVEQPPPVGLPATSNRQPPVQKPSAGLDFGESSDEDGDLKASLLPAKRAGSSPGPSAKGSGSTSPIQAKASSPSLSGLLSRTKSTLGSGSKPARGSLSSALGAQIDWSQAADPRW